ncbi:MAG TPA: hypothetical protein VFW42_11210 [Fluviicoccus sp.]|nr:hypothetical protein [Fluviicoccus sp.]
MTTDVLLHIIHTDNDVLLSREPYTSWREIQDAFPAYKASLGPWCVDDVTDYLQQEYPDLQPSAHEQVAMLLSGVETVRALSWRLPTAG